MRCKLHPYANAIGVCAPCLRDRLLALAAERDAAGDGDCNSSPGSSLGSPRRSHTTRQAFGGFPRSVSPYAAHRRSDACAYASSSSTSSHHPNLLFFRTPQVGPAARAAADEPEEKKVTRRRSFLAAIFGGHNREADRKEPPRRSTSWLSALVRRKRRPDAASLPQHPQDDGMTEWPGAGSWLFPSPSPARQHRRRHAGSSGEGISGLVVCLSPLVRPSSGGGRRRCQPPDPSAGGENHRRHLSAGSSASFGRNTSRKLADMSRFR